MKLIIDIPEEQIKKSLKESKYVLENEGIKGSVNIAMLYTNGRLEFVDIERREDFYSCNFTPLPKGHGRLIDAGKYIDVLNNAQIEGLNTYKGLGRAKELLIDAKTIIEADKAESEE